MIPYNYYIITYETKRTIQGLKGLVTFNITKAVIVKKEIAQHASFSLYGFFMIHNQTYLPITTSCTVLKMSV